MRSSVASESGVPSDFHTRFHCRGERGCVRRAFQLASQLGRVYADSLRNDRLDGLLVMFLSHQCDQGTQISGIKA